MATRDGSAEKLQSSAAPVGEFAPRGRTAAPSVRRQTSAHTVVRKRREKELFARRRVVTWVAVALLCVSFFVVVSRSANIAAVGTSVNAQKQTLEELQQQEKQLRLDLTMAGSIASIRERAQDALGMSIPDEDQVRYVDVGGLTEKSEDAAQETPSTNLFDQFMRLFD